MAEIDEFLTTRAEKGLLRNLRPISFRRNGRICLNKKEYIDFSSNDYLGLSEHPKLIAETKLALDKFGTASSASRLMSGDLEIHHQLEEKVAQFKHKEAGLVFNSGYQANLGIISSLYGRGDCIFSDRFNHASILDGIFLSGAKLFRFQHNDADNLESLLKKHRHRFNKGLIITETIFSMDGDMPVLKDLVYLKEKYNCEIFVDEAHATGIFGKNGAGIVEQEESHLTNRLDYGNIQQGIRGFWSLLS